MSRPAIIQTSGYPIAQNGIPQTFELVPLAFQQIRLPQFFLAVSIIAAIDSSIEYSGRQPSDSSL